MDDHQAEADQGDTAVAADQDAPLAARMRPRALEEFVGQPAILGPGKLLRRMIERDELRSAIFFGPPGSGKSTLAALIARKTLAHFETFSAVTAGVADVRKAIEAARRRRLESEAGAHRRTILFVDEIHRFNRAQQDAFLPQVEDGTIVLIGATTENPFFALNGPLLSRSRLFRFEPLADEDIRTLTPARAGRSGARAGGAGRVARYARGAASDRECLGRRPVRPERARVGRRGSGAGSRGPPGDHPRTSGRGRAAARAGIRPARVTTTTTPSPPSSRACAAPIPDAAVYWMARMIQAGEDPRFIARRIVIHAAEDVGMADPQALVVATAAAHAVELVGLPEAQIPMTQAAIYIATAPKSNAVVTAMHRANSDVRTRRPAAVPTHLRDASYPGAKRLGHGQGYLYPHDHPGGHVEQVYLPEGAASGPYYEPTENGYEARVRERLKRWKSADQK